MPLYVDTYGPILPKLRASTPGGSHEQQADRFANRLTGRAGSPAAPASIAPAPSPSRTGAAPGGTLAQQLQAQRANGAALAGDVRAFMESRLPYDFSGVRVHADRDAAQLSARLGAQAFTHGGHIFFGAGQYQPRSESGRWLLAHELAHVVQQTPGAGAESGLSAAPRDVVSGRWVSLGSYSWDHHVFHDYRVVVNIYVGSQSDWETRLRNLDDENELWVVKGFLETASYPAMVNRRSPRNPARARNYQNNITRAPTDDEILNFLRALYSLGGDLDLPDHTFEATGIDRSAFRRDLNIIINEHQGRLIQDVSEQNRAIESANITGIVDQTGYGTRIAMIQNAAATAMKAVDVLKQAHETSDSNALSDALRTIRNAGRTIRYTLQAHDAAVAFQDQVMQGVFDTVWSTLPGGGAIVNAGKEILKIGFKEMLKEASKKTEPAQQAERVLNEFETYVSRARDRGYLGSGEVGTLIESSAITGFEAAMR